MRAWPSMVLGILISLYVAADSLIAWNQWRKNELRDSAWIPLATGALFLAMAIALSLAAVADFTRGAFTGVHPTNEVV